MIGHYAIIVTRAEFARLDGRIGTVFELLVNAVKLFAGIRIRAISISLYLNMNLCPVTRFHNIETTKRVIRLLLLALVSDLCVDTNSFRTYDIEIF